MQKNDRPKPAKLKKQNKKTDEWQKYLNEWHEFLNVFGIFNKEINNMSEDDLLDKIDILLKEDE